MDGERYSRQKPVSPNAGRLDFRVRKGIGYCPTAMAVLGRENTALFKKFVILLSSYQNMVENTGVWLC